MSSIEEIENAVAGLPKEDLARFREWFLEFEARAWDRELEEDVKAGRLDEIAEAALRDHASGHSTEL
ncbi:MAG: hypothetical protein OES32_16480 [Acidobacteriota bacterium]|nr:hypothetical protein [Acidobacteriota bacterium]MDH3525175.1 hypothetical protein [Acidobacteriota bacterium]